MIKWLTDFCFPHEDEKKSHIVDNTKDRDNRRPTLWPTQTILYFLDKLKALFLELMVSIERYDPRYLKLSHWLELVDIVKDSMGHHGLVSKIKRNLGLEVKEESDGKANKEDRCEFCIGHNTEANFMFGTTTDLEVHTDNNKKLWIWTGESMDYLEEGDETTGRYYPNYCPECGRKLD